MRQSAESNHATVPITVTVNIDGKRWADLANTFDEVSRQQFFDWIANDMIANIMYDTPELLGEWIQRQNRRLSETSKKVG